MGLQRSEVHKHNKFALKMPSRVRIHTQVCLTQSMVIPLHTVFPELSEGSWPLTWPEIFPQEPILLRRFSPSTFDDVLQICRSSGRFIPGKIRALLFPCHHISSSAPNYMTSRPSSQGHILTLDRARNVMGEIMWTYRLETVFLWGRR